MKRFVKSAAGDLLVCVLAFSLAFGLGTLSQSCASASPRHVATGGVTALTDALVGLQQTADAAAGANLITAQKRRALAGHLLPALQGAQDLNSTILAWSPGQPIPANLVAEGQNVTNLVGDIAGAFTDPATAAKAQAYVAAAQSALILILTTAETLAAPSTPSTIGSGS